MSIWDPADTVQVPFSIEVALDTTRLSCDSSTQDRISYNEVSEERASTCSSCEIVSHLPDDLETPLCEKAVLKTLSKDLETPIFDQLYPHMWMVGRLQADHIDPLHSHLVKRREIILTEDSGMHLVTTSKIVYIKPIPRSLLNHTVWTEFLTISMEEEMRRRDNTFKPVLEEMKNANDDRPSDKLEVRKAAIGFLRSYFYLIKRPSDLRIARKEHLVPEAVTWQQWQRFIHSFGSSEILNEHVSLRYHCGQLRLSRLNWAVRIFQPDDAPSFCWYHIPFWSVIPYLELAIGPMVFIFGSASVMFSAMQVMLSTPTGDGTSRIDRLNSNAERMWFWFISVVTIAWIALIWLLCLAIPALVLFWQLQWGFRKRKENR